MKKNAVFVKNLTSGGAEKQSILLAKALCDVYEVHYIVLNEKYQEPKYLALLNECPEIKYEAFQGNLFIRFWKFCKYLKTHRINIIFSYLTAANFFAIVASSLTGVKNVYPGIRNAYLPISKTLVERILCNYFATKVILNCYSGKSFFSSKGFAKNKMVVIPNCFENITPYYPKVSTDSEICIISVGRFVAQKDYFTALEVVKKICEKCKNIKYRIVGYGELEDAIRNKVKELGLEKIVEIMINPDNIPELLEKADIYLSTSIFEGTSNSLMEAMNANLPIVATRVGDNYKLVEDQSSGFLKDVKDVVGLSSSLIELIVDDNKRKMMGRNSKKILQESYSTDSFKMHYLKLIDGKS